MALIETDLLLAVASRTDTHHEEAVEVLRRVKPLSLSPYALVELDLLLASGRIKARLPDFYIALSQLISFYGIIVPAPSPKHLELAYKLRQEYRLTYFDSLHAAIALSESMKIISYDRVYESIHGLNYIHPKMIVE